MKNFRFVAICSASGFVLSLICGFFSKSGFLHIFLIALLFALIFAGLAFGISFIYDRFLLVEVAGGEQIAGDADIVNPANDKKVLGQHVDLVIQEEDLEQSGNQNHYEVGDNHQMLNESDYAQKNDNSKNEETIVPKNEFVPLRNKETVTNFSGNEAITPKESEQRMDAIAQQEEKNGNDLDVLPDMSDLKVATTSDAGESGDTIVLSDSEESDFVRSATNYTSSQGNEPEIKDASLMAKAISSILAEET